MLQFILYFLTLLNPFALFIYLLPLKKEVGLRNFLYILARASLISYVIFTAFALFGVGIFNLLQINFEAFRIFGGLVLISFALVFIIQGKKSMVTTKGELSQIAAEVALPFLVGVGTITVSILIGESMNHLMAATTIFIVLAINYAAVAALALLRFSLRPRLREVFDQNAEIIVRLNGFIVGAFGANLLLEGVKNLLA